MKRKTMKRKKFMGWLLSTVMVFNLMAFIMPETTEASNEKPTFAGGKGTVGNPYIVTTPEQLQAISSYLNSSFKLGNDIDLSGYLSEDGKGYNDGMGWDPIGSEEEPFSGTFDGDGHTISNLKIDRETGRGVGLFGMVVPDAVIKNVGLINVDVQGKLWVGGIAGRTIGATIQQSYVTGKVSGMINEADGGSIGGLVGFSSFSVIENSYMIGQVSGNDSAGGIYGYTENMGSLTTDLIHSYAVSTIHVNGDGDRGALAPAVATLSVTHSYFNTDTFEENKGYGEGKTTSAMKLQETYNGWDFDTIWGIDPAINNGYPYLKKPQIKQDFADGDGTEDNPYQIEDAEQLNKVRDYPESNFLVVNDIDLSSYNTDEGWNPIGSYEEDQPFTGYFNGNGKTISGLTITSGQSGLGLFGYTRDAKISNVVLANADVEVLDNVTHEDGDKAGALIGYAEDTNIVHSSSAGIVKGTNTLGGLVGKLVGKSTVESSFSSADVVVTDSIGGGLIGEAIDSNDHMPEINRSYATGDVGAVDDGGNGISTYIGGFIGIATNTFIRESYAAGNLTAFQWAGGFAGDATGSLITGSYSGPSEIKAAQSAGFIASAMETTLTNDYSRANVGGNNSTAGFISYDKGSNTISNAYAAGKATSYGFGYGFGGKGIFPSNVSNSVYFDLETSDLVVLTNLEIGTPYSTAEMQSEETYSGWDFTSTWTFKPNSKDYPIFKWQLESSPESELHAPEALKATIGSREVNLTWESASGAKGYLVYMSTVPGKIGTLIHKARAEVGDTQHYSVSNLTNGTTYYFVVFSANDWSMMEKSAQISAVPAESSSGNIDTPPVTVTQPSTESSGVDVLVNGKAEKAGTATDSKRKDQTVTTIEVDEKKLEAKLAFEGNGAIVTIPVASKSDIIVGELNGQMVKNMENQQAVLKIRTAKAEYTLPAAQINIDAIVKKLGQVSDLKAVKVKIEVAVPEAETVRFVENVAAQKGTFTLVAPPLEFKVQVTIGDQTVEVTKFNAYVERMVAIPDGVDITKITTGVVVDPDGTVRHVPTYVTQVDGKYYAVINSLTNSTYSVVWHPMEFADMTGHWAKDAVNNMGSRMVIEGTGDGKFSPDRNISRAEFAAIVVRGLGLKPESYSASFKDVKATDWFASSVQTAYQYGLIKGFEDGTFRPNAQITREQAMAIVADAMKITALDSKLKAQGASLLSGYKDAEKVSGWARSSAAECLEAGIISGRSSELLAPQADMTRAEVATIIQRLLQQSGLI